MKILSSHQMKFIEQQAMHIGISQNELMENAGLNIAKVTYSRLTSSTKKSVLSLINISIF